jgi:hypothetical protein
MKSSDRIPFQRNTAPQNFNPEDGGSLLLHNIHNQLQNHKVTVRILNAKETSKLKIK